MFIIIIKQLIGVLLPDCMYYRMICVQS